MGLGSPEGQPRLFMETNRIVHMGRGRNASTFCVSLETLMGLGSPEGQPRLFMESNKLSIRGVAGMPRLSVQIVNATGMVGITMAKNLQKHDNPISMARSRRQCG